MLLRLLVRLRQSLRLRLHRLHCARHDAWQLLLPYVMRLRRLRCDRCAGWQLLLHCGASTALLLLLLRGALPLAVVARPPPAVEPLAERLVLTAGDAHCLGACGCCTRWIAGLLVMAPVPICLPLLVMAPVPICLPLEVMAPVPICLPL